MACCSCGTSGTRLTRPRSRSKAAAWSTVPNVPALFWSFRIMVALGFFFIALFAYAFWLSAKQRSSASRWVLRLAF